MFRLASLVALYSPIDTSYPDVACLAIQLHATKQNTKIDAISTGVGDISGAADENANDN